MGNKNFSKDKKGKSHNKLYLNILFNIKNEYILKQILDNINKRMLFQIIKENKNIQKKLNVNIDDYKACSKIYSSIEIEIVPVDNSSGKFININKGKEPFYHIYFNNDKIEKNIYSIEKEDKIKKIKIIIDYQIISFNNLFKGCKCIESISFKKFIRNNINSMRLMFSSCTSLKKINFSNFNTDNVTDMNSMFKNCSSLKELNLSNFNTNNVTDMSFMFSGCSSLEELDISSFNTFNLTEIDYMFYSCSSLEKLNISDKLPELIKRQVFLGKNKFIFHNCPISIQNLIKST